MQKKRIISLAIVLIFTAAFVSVNLSVGADFSWEWTTDDVTFTEPEATTMKEISSEPESETAKEDSSEQNSDIDEDEKTLYISSMGSYISRWSGSPWGEVSPWSANSKIKKIIIADGIAKIGSNAFEYCDGLVSISIPDSVKNIEHRAFYNCTSLEEIILPSGLTTIEDHAFENCKSVKRIYIPASVTTIQHAAFEGCDSLEQIIVDENNPNYSSDSSGVLYDKNQTRILQYPYSSSATTYIMPDSLESIDEGYCYIGYDLTFPSDFYHAFRNCKNLERIIVNEANAYYSSDEEGVLYNKDKTVLISRPSGNTNDSYQIPDGVVDIADYAFYNNIYLKNITVDEDVVSVGKDVFVGCPNLNTVYWNARSATPTSYRDMIFDSANIQSEGFDLIFGDSVETIPCNIFSRVDYDNLGHIVYGANVKSVTIGKNVKIVDNFSFARCTRLTNITFPSSITNTIRIGEYSFYGCTGLTNVTFPSCAIPSSIIRIENYAFADCTGLQSVSVPDTAVIRDTAFERCVNLGTDLVTVIDSGMCGEDLIWGLDEDGLLTIRGKGAMNSNPWIRYRKDISKVIIGDEVTSICASAFDGCVNLLNVVMGSSITTIDSSVFSGCTGLTEITIPDSVTSIGDSAFYGCSGLTSVTLGNSIVTIPQQTFANCTALESIVLPESVSYVEVYAFQNAGLKDIEIRNSRCVIEYNAATIPVGAVIHGYVNSPAQLYAQMYARGFVPFENTDCAHTYSAWTVDAEATCTERGLSHRSCLLCGDVDIAVTPATGHTDENGDDLCDTCGASLAANVPGGDDTPCVTHTYSDWVINAEATCTERGLSHRTCRKCGDLEISVIPATGHTDEDGDDLCDACGESLAPEVPADDEPTENGLMKIMQKIVDFFSRLAAWLKSLFAKTA